MIRNMYLMLLLKPYENVVRVIVSTIINDKLFSLSSYFLVKFTITLDHHIWITPFYLVHEP